MHQYKGILQLRTRVFILLVLGAAGIIAADRVRAHEEEGEEVFDRLTGGGFLFETPSGDQGTFAIGGGYFKDGRPWGHLNYLDHSTGMHVKASHDQIFQYSAISENERRITGDCTIDGEPGGFTVFAADNGEPGDTDTFHIFLSNGYHAGGTIDGGNIQLHKQ
jgi:hypothetical protein